MATVNPSSSLLNSTSAFNYGTLPGDSQNSDTQSKVAKSSNHVTIQIEQSDAFEQIPKDILLKIFDHVFMKSLATIKDYKQRITLQLVCKKWNGFLLDTNYETRFWKASIVLSSNKVTRTVVIQTRQGARDFFKEWALRQREADHRKKNEELAQLENEKKKSCDKKANYVVTGIYYSLGTAGCISLLLSSKDPVLITLTSIGITVEHVLLLGVLAAIVYKRCKKS